LTAEAHPVVPRLTIVTPSYNQAPYLAETIRSVLTQEGDFEIEYLVMDGGSTDGSVDIIRTYAEQVAAGRYDVRCAGVSMAWTSQRDAGQSNAINHGLRRATGQIVSFINSDDAYLPGAFQHVVAAFAADPGADFVFGDGDVIGARGELQWEWLSRPYDQKVMTSYHFLWNAFTNYIMQQATFWRRRVHNRIGYLDETFHFVMDAEYWIRAAHAGLRLVHLPRKLAVFRLIEGTKSRSSPTVFWEDYLEIFRRYHGSEALGPFLGFYYYNLARHRDFDLDRALADGRVVFSRWVNLDAEERRKLEEQSRKGFALACVLSARELLYAGRTADATLAFHRGRGQGPAPIARVAAADYLLSRAVGPAGRPILERARGFLIRQYRRRRFDYRYYTRHRT
jgi:glycosyltransferase involved in cell wall biosynthesis